MMATTQVQIYPPPSTSSRSAFPFHVPLSLSLSLFPSLSPPAGRAIFCWHFASIPALFDATTLPLSLIQPAYLGALFRPARNFHTAHFAVLFNVRHHTYTSIRLSIYQTGTRVCFAVNPLTTHFARCKTMMNTDDRTWDLAPRYDIKPSQLFAVYHWWGLY